MLVGLKSPGSLSPQSLLAALFKAEAGGRSCGRGSPYSVPFSSPGRQPPPLCLNVDLASPSLHSAGPYSGGSCKDAPDFWLPAGPLPAHSQPYFSGCPATPIPAPVRLPPTHPAQTSS